jgi:hypothetical protein
MARRRSPFEGEDGEDVDLDTKSLSLIEEYYG